VVNSRSGATDIERFGGRVIDLAEAGILAEFTSVVRRLRPRPYRPVRDLVARP
jgi:hypothetical protein